MRSLVIYTVNVGNKNKNNIISNMLTYKSMLEININLLCIWRQEEIKDYFEDFSKMTQFIFNNLF